MGWTTADLDRIDRDILAILQRDCTTPRSRIAERVGLSPPSVHERIRKLEDAGIIEGYHARLDARRLGNDVTAFIGVRLQHPRQIDAFDSEVLALAAIQECHHVTGDYTLMMKVKTRDTGGLEELIGALRSMEGVQSTVTMVVLSTQTERAAIELDAPEAAPLAAVGSKAGGRRSETRLRAR